MDGWGKVRNIAKYAGVSERTVEDWLKSGLIKCAHLPSGLRLIKYGWVDEFLESFSECSKRVDRIVNEVMRKL